MTSTIIQTGSTFRMFDSDVVPHEKLPAGTYVVNFSPMSGYSLAVADRLEGGNERIYGTHPRRLNRIFNTYQTSERSLGLILSGDKGMGKSLMLRLLAGRAQDAGLPVVLVRGNTTGLADFLDSLGEALIVFDEFEKNFDMDEQNSFLGLFDGVSTVKRFYALSVNSVGRLSDYYLNRPGRFHYHIRFDYPSSDEVVEYLNDAMPDIRESEVEKIVEFAARVSTNYDHLRAIVFELIQGGDFADIIGDLNIKNFETPTYEMLIKLADGKQIKERVRASLFKAGEITAQFSYTDVTWRLAFEGTDLKIKDGLNTVLGSDISVSSAYGLDEDEEVVTPQVAYVTFTLSGQANYSF